MSISEAAIDKIKNYSDEYIRANYEIIPWDLVCQYNKIDERTLRQFSHKLNWDLISQYQKLSENFIRDYQENFNEIKICIHQQLSRKFINELGPRFAKKEIRSYSDKMVDNLITDKNTDKTIPLTLIKNTCAIMSYDFKTCLEEVLVNPKLPEEIKTKIKIQLMLDVVKI